MAGFYTQHVARDSASVSFRTKIADSSVFDVSRSMGRKHNVTNFVTIGCLGMRFGASRHMREGPRCNALRPSAPYASEFTRKEVPSLGAPTVRNSNLRRCRASRSGFCPQN